jgi:hypothetical protein
MQRPAAAFRVAQAIAELQRRRAARCVRAGGGEPGRPPAGAAAALLRSDWPGQVAALLGRRPRCEGCERPPAFRISRRSREFHHACQSSWNESITFTLLLDVAAGQQFQSSPPPAGRPQSSTCESHSESALPTLAAAAQAATLICARLAPARHCSGRAARSAAGPCGMAGPALISSGMSWPRLGSS